MLTGTQSIRKIDINGIITTFAGAGAGGYGGDGGPALMAIFYANGLLADGNENIFIGDRYNNRVRKINTNGIITTIAGTGVSGYGGDGGPAIAAQLNEPRGIAVY